METFVMRSLLYDHVKSSFVCLMNVAIDAFPITSPFDATIYIKYTFCQYIFIMSFLDLRDLC